MALETIFLRMFDPDNDRYWKFVLAIVLRLSIYMVFLRNKNVEESFHRFIVLMHFEKYVSALIEKTCWNTV